ncbi:MAG: PepSY domain-containing protein [Beijerinckiaceae bacterium]|nr:PepSY domain-containing protein [Beijerinckiaceae bacterium]
MPALGAWQTRDALQEKIRALGWTISRIRTDDGCYKVNGTDERARGSRPNSSRQPRTDQARR